MTITWNTDVNAPGCPGEILGEDGRSILIQTDWDYPGTARTFGWTLDTVQRKPTEQEEENGADVPHCDHDGTDGTVDCKECGCTAGDFISAAYDWLADNDGATADDPGYFCEDE